MGHQDVASIKLNKVIIMYLRAAYFFTVHILYNLSYYLFYTGKVVGGVVLFSFHVLTNILK